VGSGFTKAIPTSAIESAVSIIEADLVGALVEANFAEDTVSPEFCRV
jgi:hypothetical protein